MDIYIFMKVKLVVTHTCLTLCDSMDCSLPDSSVYGILQATILKWVAIPFSRGSSQPRDWTWISCIAGRFLTIWAIRETDIYHYTFVQTHRTCGIESEPKGKMWALSDMICPCRFIFGKKCTVLVTMLINGKLYTCVGAGIYQKSLNQFLLSFVVT